MRENWRVKDEEKELKQCIACRENRKHLIYHYSKLVLMVIGQREDNQLD